VLVSKGNVMIGYNPIYEYAALPDAKRVVAAVHRVMTGTLTSRGSAGGAVGLRRVAPIAPAISPAPAAGVAAMRDVPLKVPVMGEGIRAARVVSLLKKPGDVIAVDDALCEVETDKAVYPIEASEAGVLKEWRCAVDEIVEIGREIATISVKGEIPPVAPAAPESAPSSHPSLQQLQRVPRFEPPVPPGPLAPPALSPAITRRLTGVVPANMQLDASWKAIRSARDAARQAGQEHSPSLLMAWCVVRAMERHAAFRRLVMKDGSIVEHAVFDLGIAVALEGDRLGTAVIHAAPTLAWTEFADAYRRAIAEVRAGKLEDVQSPINVTSLGSFGVEVATPIVVPPAMGTLFIGKAHERMLNDAGVVYPAEVVTLSLTFDHRVVNGAGAAAFLQDVQKQIGTFALPG
jgi:pyruvate/2-oxoglutarate dehydrogenase complex dihydrolipoamide acyltransferase (E2) component